MEKRRIKKEWIVKALEKPDEIIESDFGRKQAIKRINSHKISVIYFEEKSKIIVITVFWGE